MGKTYSPVSMSQNRGLRKKMVEKCILVQKDRHLDHEVPPVCIVIGREAFEAEVQRRGTIVESHNSLSHGADNHNGEDKEKI